MKEITYVRLDPDVKRVAEQAAKADRRSLSAFIAKLVAEWADANRMIDRTVEESR
jgi:predicted HicB family RNase H-like nuclease